MAVGTSQKRKSELLSNVVALARTRRDLPEAYRLLTNSGGIPKIVEDEKRLYGPLARKKPIPIRKPPTSQKSGELGIRNALSAKRWLEVRMNKTTQRFAIVFPELSTRRERSGKASGGSIDLYAISTPGRSFAIELKDCDSNETALSAVLQAAVYRAQISSWKYRRILEQMLRREKGGSNDPAWTGYIERALSKRRENFGVMVAAPQGWPSFEREGKDLQDLLSRRTRGSAPVYVVELDEDLSGGECIAGHVGRSAAAHV
jgi:hypothetical protein